MWHRRILPGFLSPVSCRHCRTPRLSCLPPALAGAGSAPSSAVICSSPRRTCAPARSRNAPPLVMTARGDGPSGPEASLGRSVGGGAEAGVAGFDDGLGAVGDLELGEDVRHVIADGFGAEV